MPDVFKGTWGEIDAKTKEVLEFWPLYREFTYEVPKEAEATSFEMDEEKARREGGIHLVPDEITLYCTECCKSLRWTCQYRTLKTSFLCRDYFEVEYRCNNCSGRDPILPKGMIKYFLFWHQTFQDHFGLQKVGQYPPLSIEPDSELRLSQDDLMFYKKALISRSFSHGLGALAYLRRVVENRMDALLDLVISVSGDADTETLKKVETVKAGKQFSQKVALAKDHLPAHLKPGGHNPFDVLHGLPSEGLHALSEDECLEVFDQVLYVFEYLFRQLATADSAAEAYQKQLTTLVSSRSPKKTPTR